MRAIGNVMRRARAYQTLSPTERALLKLIEGMLCAALVAGLPALAQALATGAPRWDEIARTALAAAAVAALLALLKYCKAQGDPPLNTPADPAT